MAALVYPSLGAHTECVVLPMKVRLSAQQVLENYRLLQAAQAGTQVNAELRQRLRAVEQALTVLEPEQARLLRLLYLDNPRSRVQIQQQMNISEATFYRRKKDAITAFNLVMASIC